MRREFFRLLAAEMRRDASVYLLLADLGYSYVEELMAEFQERVINCGLAEMMMIGIAKGLSDSGKKVYCYTMSPFLIFRPFELLRIIANSPCNIRLVGYETASERAGYTHRTGGKDVKMFGEISGSTIENTSIIIARDYYSLDSAMMANEKRLLYIKLEG